MKTYTTIIPALLLLAACGSLQETTQVRDDVYDIPDRNAVASITPTEAPPAEAPAEKATDDYYNPGDAKQYAQGSYYDRTYNDPYWYNTGRFGFGMSVNSWGPGYGMGMNYGGGYNNTMFNSPTGMYDPYWSNSWQSGYGMYNNPMYSNYGYYSPWNQGYFDPYAYGNGYGYGSGYGYGPYQGPYGYCATCYQPTGFGGSVVVSHRPSMGGGGTAIGTPGSGTTVGPRMEMRDPVGLLNNPRTTYRGGTDHQSPGRLTNSGATQPTRTNGGRSRSNTERPVEHESRPTWNSGGSRDSGGSWGGGGGRSGGGGGFSAPSTSPRPPR